MYKLGSVGDLKTTTKYEWNFPYHFNEDDVVYKFGRTTHLSSRNNQHDSYFKQIGVPQVLEYFALVSHDCVVDAENDLKKHLTEKKLILHCPDPLTMNSEKPTQQIE